MDSTPAASSEIPEISHDRSPDAPKRKAAPRFFSGVLITAGILLLKLKTVAFIALDYFRGLLVNPFDGFGTMQFAVAGASMVASILLYALKWPLPFSIAFALLIGIHELGHALVIRAKGLRAGLMVFIPFIGGAVTLKDQPRTVYDDAQIGLAGPIAGTFASLVVLQLFKWTNNPLHLGIALAGFVLNLINLLPIGMLDGGRISAAISKWMWVIGGGALIYKTFNQPNPMMIAILILAGFQVYASIIREDEARFYEITGAQRAAIAVAYFALVLFLGHQAWMANNRLELLRDLAHR